MSTIEQDFAVRERSALIGNGEYIGRLVHIVVLGTQPSGRAYQYGLERKIWLNWELPFELEETGQPKTIGRYYTNSMSPRAALRTDLSAARGKLYSESEIRTFDIKSVLGSVCSLACAIHIKHGRQWSDICAVSALPKSVVLPEQVNSSIFFDPKQYSLELFLSLPDTIRTKIASAPEFEATELVSGAQDCPNHGYAVA